MNLKYIKQKFEKKNTGINTKYFKQKTPFHQLFRDNLMISLEPYNAHDNSKVNKNNWDQ